MREVDAAEAPEKFDALLDCVEQGEEVVITRRGKAIARVIPVTRAFDREAGRDAAARIIEASRGVTLGGLKIKNLINEGRS